MERQLPQATTKGPADWFTGDVYIDAVARGRGPSTLNVGAVHFTPGARTAWHSHDGGQILYVTEGRGLVQARGERVVAISSGDVIYTADGEEHWHGATPDHGMTHLTFTEGDATWGAHVSDEEYRGDVRGDEGEDVTSSLG